LHIFSDVIARTNLTIFSEKTMEDVGEFYRDQRVELVATLPYYLEDSVDRVRGSGTYKKSIEVLKRLNNLGYGMGSPDLPLSLVYNPQGMFLAPPQNILEIEYKRELQERFGISFTHLYTILNMPVGRFKDFLSRTNNLDKYRERLASAFNPAAPEGTFLKSMNCSQVIMVAYAPMMGIPVETARRISAAFAGAVWGWLLNAAP